MVLQYLYEFSNFCTSTIVRNSDGLIIHDRNVDFPITDYMRNITYIAHFYRGEEKIFEATMFAGATAVMTGIKKNAFSLSLNGRGLSGHTNFLGLISNIAMVLVGYDANSKLSRDILLDCEDYRCAYKRIMETTIVSPGYFILAGLK